VKFKGFFILIVTIFAVSGVSAQSVGTEDAKTIEVKHLYDEIQEHEIAMLYCSLDESNSKCDKSAATKIAKIYNTIAGDKELTLRLLALTSGDSSSGGRRSAVQVTQLATQSNNRLLRTIATQNAIIIDLLKALVEKK